MYYNIYVKKLYGSWLLEKRRKKYLASQSQFQLSCLCWSLPTGLQLEPAWKARSRVKQVHVMSAVTLPCLSCPFPRFPSLALHPVPGSVSTWSLSHGPGTQRSSLLLTAHCLTSLMYLPWCSFFWDSVFLHCFNLHYYLSFPFFVLFSPALGRAHTFVDLTTPLI